VSCDREREPGLGYEPKTGKQEDRKHNAEELKPVNRYDTAQQCMASLKDAEDPEIDEPQKFRTGGILKGARGQFRTQCGGKERQWSQELQFKSSVHDGSHTSKTFSFP
jgi:hypothetical protein